MNDLLNSFSFQLFHNESYFVPFTVNISLLYVVSGIVQVEENEKYILIKDDFSIINIGNKLSIHKESDSVYAVILFRYDLVHQIVGTDLFRFRCNSAVSNGTRFEQFRYVIGELLSEFYVEPQMTAQKGSFFFRLLHYMISYFCAKNGDTSRICMICQVTFIERVFGNRRRVFSYEQTV